MDVPVNLAPEHKLELRLRNPVMTAAGTFGSGRELSSPYDVERLGAVVTRTVSLRPQRGHAPPRFIEAPAGLLRSTGNPNAGVGAVIRQDAPVWARWSVPVIVSIAAEDPDSTARLTARLDGVAGVSAFELDIATADEDSGASRRPALTAIVRAATTSSGLPIIARIAPGTDDPRPMAEAIERGGAQAITVSGATPGMLIDPHQRRSSLSAASGTLSGPATRPLAMWNVSRIAESTSLPIIGAGGVTSGEDVAAFIMAGASAVQVGSFSFREPGAPWRILEEFESWCEAEGIHEIDEIRGVVRGRD